jgi:hypothetical protein
MSQDILTNLFQTQEYQDLKKNFLSQDQDFRDAIQVSLISDLYQTQDLNLNQEQDQAQSSSGCDCAHCPGCGN